MYDPICFCYSMFLLLRELGVGVGEESMSPSQSHVYFGANRVSLELM